MYLRPCEERHLVSIMDIFNDTILHSTALYEYQPRTMVQVREWFEEKRSEEIPVLGYFDRQDHLLGFATYGNFRPKPAYRFTVEHSVYIHPGHRGQGAGKTLLLAIIAAIKERGYHCTIGGIDAANEPSIRLHESLGFECCGHLREVGFKFGQWLDLKFYQLIFAEQQEIAKGSNVLF